MSCVIFIYFYLEYLCIIVSSCMIFMYFYLGYFPQLLIQLKEATQYAPFDPLHHLHKPFFIKDCVHDIIIKFHNNRMISPGNECTTADIMSGENRPVMLRFKSEQNGKKNYSTFQIFNPNLNFLIH